ncbi:TetR/AcrR family transcriptional regulator [Rhodovulum sp. DZ06]|uniref:TetR/AcrR family transcriptional regulator n=1 Tax=Rhodovulum sp. DZ06 TaxID=3425126 RepID=UPI003D34132F
MTDASTARPSLRDTLIDSACALLAEGGREALTLRRCAARAGVSHAAPAHHFDGLDGLLVAVAGRGFERFADALESAAAEIPETDPRGRLRALVRGYMAFAQDHSGLFSLMFRKAERPATYDPAVKAAADRSWIALESACAPFARSERELRTMSMQVWSLAHGYAFLAEAGQVDPAAEDGGGFAAVTALLDQIGNPPNSA